MNLRNESIRTLCYFSSYEKDFEDNYVSSILYFEKIGGL